MTDLVEVLQAARDTIIKVEFQKKIDVKDVQQKIEELSAKDLKDEKKMKALSKELSEGKAHTITGHLIDDENLMGRSFIADLNAPKDSNVRQVDHRTIQSIIFRNVKYELGRKKPGTEEVPLKEKDVDVKWNGSL